MGTDKSNVDEFMFKLNYDYKTKIVTLLLKT